MKVLFRVDCDCNIGTGHLFRCRQMAEFFREKGWDIRFLINDNEFTENVIKEYNYKKIGFAEIIGEIEATKRILDRDTFDIIIVDFYEKSKNDELMSIFADHSKQGVVAITDDFRKVNIKSDYLIATEPSQTHYNYKNIKQKVFSGERYCIVSQKFIENKVFIKKEVENILISFGGHDPYDASYLVANHLIEADQSYDLSKITFNFLIGGIYKYVSELRQFLVYSRLNCNFYKDLPSVVPLFLKSDVAITACGNTIYELCNIGVPIIGIGLNDRQHEAGLSLQNKKLIKYAGYYSEINEIYFNDLLLSFIKSYAERLKFHKSCKEHFTINSMREIYSFLKERIS